MANKEIVFKKQNQDDADSLAEESLFLAFDYSLITEHDYYSFEKDDFKIIYYIYKRKLYFNIYFKGNLIYKKIHDYWFFNKKSIISHEMKKYLEYLTYPTQVFDFFNLDVCTRTNKTPLKLNILKLEENKYEFKEDNHSIVIKVINGEIFKYAPSSILIENIRYHNSHSLDINDYFELTKTANNLLSFDGGIRFKCLKHGIQDGELFEITVCKGDFKNVVFYYYCSDFCILFKMEKDFNADFIIKNDFNEIKDDIEVLNLHIFNDNKYSTKELKKMHILELMDYRKKILVVPVFEYCIKYVLSAETKSELNIDNEGPLNEHELSMIKLLMY